MKKGIHPTFYPDALIVCGTCGTTFRAGSTKKEVHLDLCSNCHPFYTGTQRIVDTAGQVERFTKRLEAREAIAPGQGTRQSKKERRALERARRSGMLEATQPEPEPEPAPKAEAVAEAAAEPAAPVETVQAAPTTAKAGAPRERRPRAPRPPRPPRPPRESSAAAERKDKAQPAKTGAPAVAEAVPAPAVESTPPPAAADAVDTAPAPQADSGETTSS